MPIVVQGLPEAVAALDPEKVAAANNAMVEDLADELSTAKGDGLGVANNSLQANVSSGLAVVESSLNWPRTAGTAWLMRSYEDAETYGAQIMAAQGEALATDLDG